MHKITIPGLRTISRTCLIILVFLVCSNFVACFDEIVTISDETTHYRVTLDMTKTSHYNIGKIYGEKVLEKIPDFEQYLDSYIIDVISYALYISGTDPNDITPELINEIYSLMLYRVSMIKTNIPKKYRKEIEGFSSVIASAGTINNLNDGKLSVDELYLINLIPDVARMTECSAISAFGNDSDTGSTITARALDWYSGSTNQLGRIQAVTIFKNGNKSIYSIGYLGFFSMLTGFNNKGLFAAILDSPTWEPLTQTYPYDQKRSYPFDLRKALENSTSLDSISSYMTDSSNSYTYGHLIFLSDKNKSCVIENDISDEAHRQVRYADSLLRAGTPPIPFTNTIVAVNSFMLDGTIDNFTWDPMNTGRYISFQELLNDYAPVKLSVNNIKSIMGYYKGTEPGSIMEGDIYNNECQQLVLFQPETLSLEVYFRPKNNVLDSFPIYEAIPVTFD